jgi:hypothetical protein
MAGFIDLFQVTKNERHWVANLPHMSNCRPEFRDYGEACHDE